MLQYKFFSLILEHEIDFLKMKKKILIVYAIPYEGIKSLENDFELIYPKNKEMFSRDEILNYLPDCHAVVSIFTQAFDAEMIKAAPYLELIANYGVGYNNIDLEEAKKRNIKVTNTPNPVTEPTAEHTLALMLSVARRISELDRKIRKNKIEWGVMKNLGSGLQKKTLGIVGMGRIGQVVARMSDAFGMKIIYFSRSSLSPIKESQLLATRVSFHELLQRADFVSLHVPLTNETKHLISVEELNLMKPSAYLINTARGAVVDEVALVDALKNNKIKGAGLDVFENEPSITEELKTFDNVVLSPHVGTGTYETRVEIGREVVDNIIAYFKGKTPPNLVY